MIDGKNFFETPIKIKKVYKNIIETKRSNDYTINLLDYEHFSKR